ncbi:MULTISPECIES: hypothetical protein [unclassified Pantoea]|uniref:hypothetical protein n=1 Tax=unclassified Pantoea TaxID=2630326 RepID=UPI00301D2C4A
MSKKKSKISSFLGNIGKVSMFITVMLNVSQQFQDPEKAEMHFKGNHLFNVTVIHGDVINGNVTITAPTTTLGK